MYSHIPYVDNVIIHIFNLLHSKMLHIFSFIFLIWLHTTCYIDGVVIEGVLLLHITEVIFGGGVRFMNCIFLQRKPLESI